MSFIASLVADMSSYAVFGGVSFFAFFAIGIFVVIVKICLNFFFGG